MHSWDPQNVCDDGYIENLMKYNGDWSETLPFNLRNTTCRTSKESHCFCLNSYFGIVQWDPSLAAGKFRASPRWIATVMLCLALSLSLSLCVLEYLSVYNNFNFYSSTALQHEQTCDRSFDVKMPDYPTIRIKYQIIFEMTHNIFLAFCQKKSWLVRLLFNYHFYNVSGLWDESYPTDTPPESSWTSTNLRSSTLYMAPWTNDS